MCSSQKIAVCQDDPLNDLGRPGPLRTKISLGKCGSSSWEFPCVRTFTLRVAFARLRRRERERERKRQEDSVREGRRKGDRERKRERERFVLRNTLVVHRSAEAVRSDAIYAWQDATVYYRGIYRITDMSHDKAIEQNHIIVS